MTAFDYQPRTRIVYGAGSLRRLGDLSRELGFRRSLLVADRGMLQAGYVAAALVALDAAGVAATPYHDFGENTDSAMVEAGRAFAARPFNASLLGGGRGRFP